MQTTNIRKPRAYVNHEHYIRKPEIYNTKTTENTLREKAWTILKI